MVFEKLLEDWEQDLAALINVFFTSDALDCLIKPGERLNIVLQFVLYPLAQFN